MTTSPAGWQPIETVVSSGPHVRIVYGIPLPLPMHWAPTSIAWLLYCGESTCDKSIHLFVCVCRLTDSGMWSSSVCGAPFFSWPWAPLPYGRVYTSTCVYLYILGVVRLDLVASSGSGDVDKLPNLLIASVLRYDWRLQLQQSRKRWKSAPTTRTKGKGLKKAPSLSSYGSPRCHLRKLLIQSRRRSVQLVAFRWWNMRLLGPQVSGFANMTGIWERRIVCSA